MNGLHDLKMYSRYDCHCRLRIDKLSDVCTHSVGLWLESLYGVGSMKTKSSFGCQLLFSGWGMLIVKIIWSKQQPGSGNEPQKVF